MPRGRSYPAIGLPDAIERARELYDQDDRALTTPEAAVGAWGYTSLNGASLRVLSALRQYGLVADVGDKIKLSDRALAIIVEPEDSPERAKAIREAAKEPTVFQELLDANPDGLPSDAALKSVLVRDDAFGFKSGPADKLISALRESLALAGTDGRSYSTPSDDETPPENNGGEPPDPDEGNRAKRKAAAPMHNTAGIEPKVQDLTIPLRGGGMAVLSVPVPMTRQNYEKLTGWLRWAEDTLVAEDRPAFDPGENGGDEPAG